MNRFNFALTDKHLVLKDQDEIYDFSIFNSSKFIKLHNENGLTNSYSLHLKSTLQCLGVCHFSKGYHGLFQSPCVGSFGGFEFLDSVSLELKELFILAILKCLQTDGAVKVNIILPPDIYNLGNNAQVFSILHRQGFSCARIELNQYINVEEYELQKSVSHGNRTRINNWLKAGFEFKEIETENAKTAYQVIVTNRTNRNFPITMKWSALEKMIELFKTKMVFLGVYDQGQLIASAICINVTRSILYVFYWGDIPGYETLSPIALLSNQIIEYGKRNSYKIIDIGTSSENSIPNLGLFNFKKSIGCHSCLKLHLTKEF